ncbi:uncharacterized protein [Coffea arabica]|uniref:Uncharacterized protein isoform X2 n=1 Tax=Coffea arabica TaxID=13443 RepID=A0ABM4X3Q9_COFAR
MHPKAFPLHIFKGFPFIPTFLVVVALRASKWLFGLYVLSCVVGVFWKELCFPTCILEVLVLIINALDCRTLEIAGLIDELSILLFQVLATILVLQLSQWFSKFSNGLLEGFPWVWSYTKWWSSIIFVELLRGGCVSI